jgi:hypothetical protein
MDRGSGVDVEKLAGSGSREPGASGSSNDIGSSSLLDSQFSAENEGQTQYGLMEQHMMQYIDEKLSKKDEQDRDERNKPMTAEDELYIIPDHLKLDNPQESQDNGAETWLTGIVEVELPLDEKLRNIEDTERAKRKILDERRRGVLGSGFIVDTSSDKGYRRLDQKSKKRSRKPEGPVSESSKRLSVLPGPGNFNANFVQHRPTREVKESATGGPLGSAGRRPELSSDDIVMERFKKRFTFRK